MLKIHFIHNALRSCRFGALALAWMLCLLLPSLARADQLFEEDNNDSAGPALIFIHGWNNNRSKWDEPIRLLREKQPALMKRVRLYRYQYYWSQPIEISGLNFNNEIKRVLGPNQSFVIVAHSMGGLVARSALENYTGQTAGLSERLLQLITLDTPHHGSPFANIGWVQEDSKIKRADAVFLFGQRVWVLAKLDNAGGYGLGWDNSDGQMPDVAWNGTTSRSRLAGNVPRASRFTALLNARGNLTPMQAQSLAPKYSAVGSYHRELPDKGVSGTLGIAVFNRPLAGRIVLGRFYQNSDGSTDEASARWVDNYVANDGVVPLSSSLFMDDGAKTGHADGDQIRVDVAREITPFHRRIGTIKVVQNVEHSAVPDNTEVLTFVADRLRYALQFDQSFPGVPDKPRPPTLTPTLSVSAPILVIDRSGSIADSSGVMGQVQGKAEEVVVAIRQIVSSAAVINFSGAGNSAIDTGFTNDEAALLRAIRSPSIDNTGTAIYDAVGRAVEVARTRGDRTMMILFTDGQNNQGRGLEEAIRTCKAASVPVVIVGFSGTEGRDETPLRKLAISTGGFYVPSESADIASLLERFRFFSQSKAVSRIRGSAD